MTGIANMVQRLKKADWTVNAVALETAQALVAKYHYARGGANTATYTHGLFRRNSGPLDGRCYGVTWWIPPTKSAARATFPSDWRKVLSLSRLVVVPEAPRNACTFLLSRSMQMIDRNAWPCLVTYADEWRGHTGAIYRAANWEYRGLTAPEQVWTLSGRMVARKAGPKTRTQAQMKAMGAVMEGRFAKHKFCHLSAPK